MVCLVLEHPKPEHQFQLRLIHCEKNTRFHFDEIKRNKERICKNNYTRMKVDFVLNQWVVSLHGVDHDSRTNWLIIWNLHQQNTKIKLKFATMSSYCDFNFYRNFFIDNFFAKLKKKLKNEWTWNESDAFITSVDIKNSTSRKKRIVI